MTTRFGFDFDVPGSDRNPRANTNTDGNSSNVSPMSFSFIGVAAGLVVFVALAFLVAGSRRKPPNGASRPPFADEDVEMQVSTRVLSNSNAMYLLLPSHSSSTVHISFLSMSSFFTPSICITILLHILSSLIVTVLAVSNYESCGKHPEIVPNFFECNRSHFPCCKQVEPVAVNTSQMSDWSI